MTKRENLTITFNLNTVSQKNCAGMPYARHKSAFVLKGDTRMLRNMLIAIVLMGLLQVFASAAEINVPADYSTIQAAVYDASDGDVIILAPQTYYESVYVSYANVTIRSSDPDNMDVVNATVIDGSGEDYVLNFSGVDQSDLLLGVTIVNGGEEGAVTLSGSSGNISNCIIKDSEGGGICAYDCYLDIRDCTITNNDGGGIGAYGGYLDIRDCTITNNYGAGGIFFENVYGSIADCTIKGNSGGIDLYDCDYYVDISNCTISNNNGYQGGAISISEYSYNITILNCLLYDNYADEGGALYCAGYVDVVNCTICNNEAEYGGGVYYYDGSLVFTNSILSDNTADEGGEIYNNYYTSSYSYCYIEGGLNGSKCEGEDVSGSNNLDYTQQLDFVDPSYDNYRLLSTSVCIDAGLNSAISLSLDLHGAARKIDGDDNTSVIVDVGCYEYWGDAFPYDPDDDDDGLFDWWEYTNNLDPQTSNIGLDTDLDGILDTREYELGTDPTDSDSDNDGFSDGVEVYTFGTDPLISSADDDSDDIPDEVDPDPDNAATSSAPEISEEDVDIEVDGDSVTVTLTIDDADEVMIDGMYVEESEGAYSYDMTDLVDGEHDVIITTAMDDGSTESYTTTVTIDDDPAGTFDTGSEQIAILNIPEEGLTVSTGRTIKGAFENKRTFHINAFVNDGSDKAKVVVTHNAADPTQQTIYYPVVSSPAGDRLINNVTTGTLTIKLFPGLNTIDIFTRHNYKQRTVTLHVPRPKFALKAVCTKAANAPLRDENNYGYNWAILLALERPDSTPPRSLEKVQSASVDSILGAGLPLHLTARVSTEVGGGYYAISAEAGLLDGRLHDWGGGEIPLAFNYYCKINGQWVESAGQGFGLEREPALYHVHGGSNITDYALAGSGRVGGRDIKGHGEDADFHQTRLVASGLPYINYKVETESENFFSAFGTVFFPLGKALDIVYIDVDRYDSSAIARAPALSGAGIFYPLVGSSYIYDYGNFYGANIETYTFDVNLEAYDTSIAGMKEDFTYPGMLLNAPPGAAVGLYLAIIGDYTYTDLSLITAQIRFDYDPSKLTLYDEAGTTAITTGTWNSAYGSLYDLDPLDPLTPDLTANLKLKAVSQISQSSPETIKVQLKIMGPVGVFEVRGTQNDMGYVLVEDEILVSVQ